MDTSYIGNLRALAGVHYGYISEQTINLLCLKHNLSKNEMNEMILYCRNHGITIYDEEKEDPLSENINTTAPQKVVAPLTEEQKQLNRMADKVSRSIMHIASVKAIRRVGGPLQGWLCGTYTSSVTKSLAERVKHVFTREQLQFLIDHLPSARDEDKVESFSLTDADRQDLCDELSAKLNNLIPTLHVNRMVSDLFDE